MASIFKFWVRVETGPNSVNVYSREESSIDKALEFGLASAERGNKVEAGIYDFETGYRGQSTVEAVKS